MAWKFNPFTGTLDKIIGTIDYSQVCGLTPGALLYGASSGCIKTDTDNWYYDETLKRVGFGVGTTPSARMDLGPGTNNFISVMNFTCKTAGGSGDGISYSDSGSVNRSAFFFPGSNVVVVGNRAANGVVQIRANVAAGGGGERIVAQFGATEIVFNDASNDVDFRVESASHTDAFLLDYGADTITLGVLGAGYVKSDANGLLSVESSLDHGGLGGLTADDHTQYALLLGRSGGQTLVGGTDASDDLRLQSTSNATKGYIYLGTGNQFILRESDGSISFGQERFDMTISGSSYNSRLSLHSSISSVANLELHTANDTAAQGAVMYGARSRGSHGSESAVQSGDNLLDIVSIGHDGTDYEPATRITHEVDGTVSNNIVPGRIVFKTANTSGTLGEKARLTSSGYFGIGNTPTAYGDFAASTTSAASLRMRSGTAPSSPNDGDLWLDSTQQTNYSVRKTTKEALVGCIYSNGAIKEIAGTTTSLTTLSASGVGTLTLPANFLVVGKTIRVRVRGYTTKAAASSQVWTITLGGTTIGNTAAVALGSPITGCFILDYEFVCLSTGVSGIIRGQGSILQHLTTTTYARAGMSNSSTITINTTTSNALDVQYRWTTSQASNTLTADVFTVEVLS